MATWGVELWDQRDTLEKHTHNGIDFLDKCASFMKERIRIEQEYAKSLRRLVKQYQFKKKEEEDLPYTYQQAFKSFLQENDDFAGQQEVISEEMYNNILKEMQKLSLESKTDRKKTLQKLTEHKTQLDHHHKALLVTKRKYDQASEEAATALKGYETASQSLDLTKAQILKFQKTSQDKGTLAEKAQEDYKACLDTFNGKQTLHYEGEMPNIINNELQKSEEKRIEKLSSYFQEYVTIQQKVSPIVLKCLDGMSGAAKICDPIKDSLTLIDHYKSGVLHPSDIEFEEWGKPVHTLPTLNQKLKINKPKKKKEALNNDNYANDFSDLPPAQRLKKFNKTISGLEEELSKLEQAKAGMVKIKETSEKFGGDLQTIQGQIDVNEKQIERVKSLIHQYQCYLAAAMEGEMQKNARPSSIVETNPTPPPPPPPAYCEEAEEVDSVVPPPPPPLPPAPEFVGEEFDEPRCTVLYDFSGSNDGEMTVYAGEELVIAEDEDGSGWIRVLRGGDEGYIPSSYIEKI